MIPLEEDRIICVNFYVKNLDVQYIMNEITSMKIDDRVIDDYKTYNFENLKNNIVNLTLYFKGST